MTDREQATQAPEEPKQKRIAVIMAHPDDAEFVCGASVAKWADEGHEVYYVIVTNGDKGSHDKTIPAERLAAIRKEEQRAAAAILGVKDILFLDWPDGMVVPDLNLRRELVRAIRRLKPTVVVTGDPTVYWVGSEYINHPDHRAVAEATLAALYPAAGNHRYFPELLEEGFEPHMVDELYMHGSREPNLFIDITRYLDKKIAALRAHASQLGEWDPEEMVRQWASEEGKRANPPVEYAESFKRFTPEG
ncbi:MAG TPA: PIG-L deacetylase family protein [Thermomicrobiales bacterium]